MKVVTIDVPALGNRCHLVHDGRAAVVVDPPRGSREIERAAEREQVEIVAVADTHVHNDYVSGALGLARRHGADYLLAADEAVEFERVGVRHGDVLRYGALEVEVLATPGHTRHHQSFLVDSPSGAPGAVHRRQPPSRHGRSHRPGRPAAGSSTRRGPVDQRPPAGRARAGHRRPSHPRLRQLLRRRHRDRLRHGALDRRAARHSPRPHHRQGDLRDRPGRGLRPRPRPLRPHGPAQPEGRRQRSGPPRPSRDRRAGHRCRAGRRVGGGPARPLRVRQRARPRHGERGVRQAVRDVRRLAGAVGRRDPPADRLAHASRAGAGGPGRHRDRRCHRPGADRRRHGDGELPARRLDRLPRCRGPACRHRRTPPSTSGRAVTCPVPCTSRCRTSTSPGRTSPAASCGCTASPATAPGSPPACCTGWDATSCTSTTRGTGSRELAIQTTQEAA